MPLTETVVVLPFLESSALAIFILGVLVAKAKSFASAYFSAADPRLPMISAPVARSPSPVPPL